jgi:hypothetical protein
MSEKVVPDCPACGVSVGKTHRTGCTLAPCTRCGFPRTSCRHGILDIGYGACWLNDYPGDREIYDGLGSSLQEIRQKALAGELRWSPQRQRFVRRQF